MRAYGEIGIPYATHTRARVKNACHVRCSISRIDPLPLNFKLYVCNVGEILWDAVLHRKLVQSHTIVIVQKEWFSELVHVYSAVTCGRFPEIVVQ